MVFREGDIDCVEELIRPAERVLKERDSIRNELFERRVELWNRIKENYERYLDGECGKFLNDLDMHFRSQFEVALLILAASFRENNEEFRPARRFSDKEIEVYKEIESYNAFEILSIDDIKRKIASRDSELLELLRKYYVYMKRWCEEVVEDSSIKLPIRHYLKKKCKEYRGKIDEAISSLIVELDWLAKLISQWERGAESLAEKKVEEVAAEIKAEAARAVEEEEKRIESLKEEIAKKEEEVKAKEDELKVKEEEVRRVIEELRGIRERVEKGSRFVDVGRAKQYEMNFIGRIERKVGEEVELFGKIFKVEEVKEGKEVDTSRFIGMRSKWGILTERDAKNVPENRYIVARLVEKKLLGRKKSYVLKAVFVSRVDRYAEYGFDTDPLELRDVNVYVVDARDEAKQKGENVVLCLASPTGFEESVKEHINSDEFHRNFLSKYLSVCLVDLETGKLLYNPHDSVAKEFAKICEIEIDEEKKSRVKKCVEKMMEGREWITLKEALSCGGEDIVKVVFYELSEENMWKVRYIEGVGLVLMK